MEDEDEEEGRRADMTQESEREEMGDRSVFVKVELGNGPDAAEPVRRRRTLGNRSFLLLVHGSPSRLPPLYFYIFVYIRWI